MLQDEYINRNKDERKDYFYMIRDKYNSQVQRFNFDEYNEDWIKRASYLIFLNKTCFNGLFRQNKNGKFNVPHGRYKKPNICDRDNIMEVNKALKTQKSFTVILRKPKILSKKTALFILTLHIVQ